MPPLRIVEQSDKKAMATLAAFMAESASGPEALSRLLANRDKDLAWIRDESLRNDVAWGLARELLVEGKEKEAANTIQHLVEQGYSSGEAAKWAPRAALAGKILFASGNEADAAYFFQKAAQGYRDNKQPKEEAGMLDSLGSALIAMNRTDDAMAVLARVDGLSTRTPLVRARVLATMGRIARAQGKNDEARKYFTSAMALWPDGQKEDGGDMGSAKVCLAEALLESGRNDEAEKMFRNGLSELHGKDGELSFTTSALRGLAQIASQKGNYQEALSWLYKAEGAAMGRIAHSDAFWPCLYDQRGWVLLNKAEPKEAAADFRKVVGSSSAPDARVQSCEGLGEAYIELGRAEDAHKYLSEAIRLREEHYPGDFVSLGRVYKGLGMACDLLGRNEDALQAYNKAVEAFEKAGKGGKFPLYSETLLCKSHALTELSRWQEAADAFQRVIPLLEGEEKVETLKLLANCYDQLGMRDKGDECWRQAGFPRVAPAAPSRRR